MYSCQVPFFAVSKVIFSVGFMKLRICLRLYKKIQKLRKERSKMMNCISVWGKCREKMSKRQMNAMKRL